MSGWKRGFETRGFEPSPEQVPEDDCKKTKMSLSTFIYGFKSIVEHLNVAFGRATKIKVCSMLELLFHFLILADVQTNT